jgi:hypothetical protein
MDSQDNRRALSVKFRTEFKSQEYHRISTKLTTVTGRQRHLDAGPVTTKNYPDKWGGVPRLHAYEMRLTRPIKNSDPYIAQGPVDRDRENLVNPFMRVTN